MPPATTAALAVVAGFFAYTVCVIVAIVLQDHSSLLPLGLFNDGRREYDVLSYGALAVFTVLALLFGRELVRRRTTLAGRIARAGIAYALLFEAVLTAFDVGWVSRDPRSRFAGPFYERRMASGEWIYLRKSPRASVLGFRNPRDEPPHSAAPRVLFLGDSYTEGSGSDFPCNYPTVAEAELSRRLARPIEVMSAGVAGYGPIEEWRAFRFLEEEGFRFDAVVLNLFLENDFTDDLPATERRIVAGIGFRFPTSRFLRIFHPLNTRLFRYAIFVRTTTGLITDASLVGKSVTTKCTTEPELPITVNDVLRDRVERRLATNYGGAMELLALSEVERAIDAIRDLASARGLPLVLVVFPDRIVAEPALRDALAIDTSGHTYDFDRLDRWVRERFPDLPQIHVIDALGGATGLFKMDDTHLSDVGNVRAGELVGARLAELLGPRLPH